MTIGQYFILRRDEIVAVLRDRCLLLQGIQDLKNEGKSFREIAAILGYSHTYIFDLWKIIKEIQKQ